MDILPGAFYCLGYGITTDGTTKYINASICTLNYKPTQRPIVFDIKLPPGMTKTNYDAQEIVISKQASAADSESSGISQLSSEVCCLVAIS